jgi:hypothetical protein
MFGAIGLSLALASPVVYTPPAFADNPSPSNAAGETSIRPFHAHFSDAQLADLRARIAATRWPDKETVGDRSQGAQLDKLKGLVDIGARAMTGIRRRTNSMPCRNT